jgi:hypothetical protein
MKGKMLEQVNLSAELKEKLVLLVVYKTGLQNPLAQQYGLPNVHVLVNSVRIYKKTLETGAVTLPVMHPKNLKDARF